MVTTAMSEFECQKCGLFMHALVRKALNEECRGELDIIVETFRSCGARNVKSWQRFVQERVHRPGEIQCMR